MAKFYAVAVGKEPGLYDTWDECKAQVTGFPNAKYKSFDNQEDALEFLEQSTDDYSDSTENDFETYAFVDGSFNSKTNTYGYGGFLIHKHVEEKDNGKKTWLIDKTIIKGSGNDIELAELRNITGEILGCMEAVKEAIKKKYKTLAIFYDYAGIEMWATGMWNRNKKATQDYYEFMQSIKDKIDIKFIKVKGHTKIDGNEEADRLAKEACGILETKSEEDSDKIIENAFHDLFDNYFNEESENNNDL